MGKNKLIDLSKMIVEPGRSVSLKDFETEYKGDELNKESSKEILEDEEKHFAELQDKMYADNSYSLLIVLQAMDTAGKDGIIKHVIAGMNPAGVKVASFKAPSSTELDHDYLWRHYKELPARGEVGIFNRSHYENVLVTKVHPEFILKENLPGIESVKDIDDKFWQQRYKQINRFEKNLVQNGTIILKFYLHLSRKEQKKRLIERIDDPKKNWKFSIPDLKERAFWKDYQRAYEDCLSATSTDFAPWFIIPADDKWYGRLCVSAAINDQFEKLNLQYPEVGDKGREELQQAKAQLMNEEE